MRRFWYGWRTKATYLPSGDHTGDPSVSVLGDIHESWLRFVS